MIPSRYLAKILQYHAPIGSETALFSKVDKGLLDKLYKNGDCHFFPSLSDPALFFILGNTYLLEDGDYQLLESLTVFRDGPSFDRSSFASYLNQWGDAFLVLVESYNHQAKEMLNGFQCRGTHYCQQKLFCNAGDVLIKPHATHGNNISIRNFLPGRDERAYAELYNQLLGHLGTKVDVEFVKTIVQSPSFNPDGYFLAENDGSLVGFFAMEKAPWGEGESDFGYIYQIGVSERWKGTGLADRLLQYGMNFAKKNSISKIGIGISRGNRRATCFFLERNFKTVFDISGYGFKINNT